MNAGDSRGMGMTAELYPWRREFRKEFDPRAGLWFLAGLAAAGGLLLLFVYVRTPREVFRRQLRKAAVATTT